jgi:hypothetical protein
MTSKENQALELVGGRLSKTTGTLAEIAKAAKQRPVLMLDVSGSMSETVGQSSESRRKIDLLRDLVLDLRKEADFLQMIFDTHPEFCEEICEPRGGTALHEALDLASTQLGARRFVLITDGYPDSADAALRAAEKLPAPLDIFYVGPVGDIYAQEFLKKLAAACKGQYGAADLSALKMLGEKVKLALNPAPKGIAL